MSEGCKEHSGAHHCNYECKGGHNNCDTYTQAMSQDVSTLINSDPSAAQTLVSKLRNSTSPICYTTADTSCENNTCPLKHLCAKTVLNTGRAIGSVGGVAQPRKRFVVT